VLIAKGDSWFNYPDVFSTDIAKELSRNGYDTTRNDSRWGDTICNMKSSLGNVHDFIYNGLDAAPKAILLSGGGNDIVNVLATLLKPSRPGPGGWDQAAVDDFFNKTLRPAYISIITQIATWCMAKFEKQVPTIIHGYGNPIPDDRGFPPFHAPWLGPVFVAQGYGDPYGDPQGHPILNECAPLAVDLLTYFNKMLALLPSSTDLAGVNPNVIYVDLRPELCSDLTKDAYKNSWANELHPTVAGWQQVARRIIQALQAIP
jgi:lysophospholipase L1-like esterase